MIHNTLCPQGGGASIITTDGLGDFPCLCELIARVRDSQGTTNQMDLEAKYWTGFKHGQEAGYKDAIAAAVQRVEALADDMGASTEWCRDYEADKTGNTRNPRVWIREAVAAIKGDQP